MLYNVRLVSAIPQRESAISMDPSLLSLPSAAPVSAALGHRDFLYITKLPLCSLRVVSFSQVSVCCNEASVVARKRRDARGCCCCCLVAQSCLTLWDSMECSPLGSFVPGISQARRVERVADAFSRGFS